MNHHQHHHPRVGTGERGSVSLLVVVLAAALLIVAALVVDGGRKVQAIAVATAIAEEAARAGAQALDPTALAEGRPAAVDPSRAHNEAAAYLAAALPDGTAADPAVTGTAINTTADTITVEVTLTRPTVFLGAIGVTTVTGRGSGRANLAAATGASP